MMVILREGLLDISETSVGVNQEQVATEKNRSNDASIKPRNECRTSHIVLSDPHASTVIFS